MNHLFKKLKQIWSCK